MAAHKKYEPSWLTRVLLPTFVIAGLGLAASYLGNAPVGLGNPGYLHLLSTGVSGADPISPTPVTPSPVTTDTTDSAAATDAPGSPAATRPAGSPSARMSPNGMAGTPVAAPPGAPGTPATAVDPGSGTGDCDSVNGFSIKIIEGQPTCAKILEVADPYTQAVLSNQLGRELSWSGQGWDCIRNFDESGVTANAHGLVCAGYGKFLLVSEG